jgi:HK97 family phage major capsid protein
MKLTAERLAAIGAMTMVAAQAAITTNMKAIKELEPKIESGSATAEDLATWDMHLAEENALDERVETLKAAQVTLKNRKKAKPDGGNDTDGSGGETHMKVRDGIEDDPKCGFRDAKEFFGAVRMQAPRMAHSGQIEDNRLRRLYVAASDSAEWRMAVGSDEHATFNDPYGGFLVPEAMLPNVLTVDGPANEGTDIDDRVIKLPMPTPKVRMPVFVDKDRRTSVSGGLRVYRRSEAQTVTSSRMTWKTIALEADGLMGIAYITDEMIEDGMISIASLLGQQFPKEFRKRIVKEMFYGTGAGELEGVFNNPALITVSKETSQAADTIKGLNVMKMRMRCWGYEDAVWYASLDSLVEIMNLHVVSDGNAGIVKLFHPGNPDAGIPATIMGRPVKFSEFLQPLGDLKDICLINPTQYYYGVYKPLTNASSVHVRFDTNEVAYKFSMRNAGKSPWRETLIPNESDGTFTQSPFVTLEARA